MAKNFIHLKNGDRLAYQVYGGGEHTLVLFHGQLVSSWLEGSWRRAIDEADVKCIVFDRPGYGDSSVMSITKVGDWIPLFTEAVRQLGLRSLDVVGISAGGPYAYATAAGFPELVGRVWLLGGVPAVFRPEIFSLYPPKFQKGYLRLEDQPLSETQDYFENKLAEMKKGLRGEPGGYYENSLNDVSANRCIGPAREGRLHAIPWGFDPFSVTQPATLYHAKGDAMVPYEAAAQMARMLPDAKLITFEESDFRPGVNIHFSSINKGFFSLLKAYPKKPE